MSKDKIYLASNNVELSETKSYIELTNILCYYDVPNENGVLLPLDKALEKAETLVNMPVVAKYKVVNGQPDLGGHEAYIDPITKEIAFDTQEIGTHTSVEIKEAEIELHGEKRTLPCLFATSRIWTTRQKNTVKAIKRLYDEGKLTSSWEVSVSSYEFKDGIKVLNDYSFDANCLLGSKVLPAYPCASVLDIASLEQSQLMIAEALTKDKEEVNMENIIAESSTVDVEQPEVQATPEEPVSTETSALTIQDLRKRLRKACQSYFENKNVYFWISFIMVDENYCLCDTDELDELEFYKINYVIENGEVTISEPEMIKLVVSVADINTAISSRDDEIISNKATIANLEEEISELKKYKEIVDKTEEEKAEAEKAKKIANLKTLAQTGGYISATEIEEDETIKTMISSLDEAGIKNLIVDRMLASKSEVHTEISESVHTDVTETESVENVSAFNFYMNLR